MQNSQVLKKEFVLKQLRMNKGVQNELKLEELEKYLKDKQISLLPGTSKKELVKIISEKCIDDFMERYENLFIIPDFELKKMLHLTSTKVLHELELREIITPGVEMDIFYSNKESFKCRGYDLSILDLDPKFIQDKVKEFNLEEIKIRIEVPSLELLPQITKGIEEFVSISGINAVMKNGQGGHYCYFVGNLKKEGVYEVFNE